MANSAKHQQTSHQEIARLAYQIWEQRGHPQGCEVEFWLEAERRMVSTEESSQEQRTASVQSPGTPALQDQPGQSSAKSASQARSRTRRRATTKPEGEIKKGTALTSIPRARQIQLAERDGSPVTAAVFREVTRL
jgi:hypothetical protein